MNVRHIQIHFIYEFKLNRNIIEAEKNVNKPFENDAIKNELYIHDTENYDSNVNLGSEQH